jgi:hypothetical protein
MLVQCSLIPMRISNESISTEQIPHRQAIWSRIRDVRPSMLKQPLDRFGIVVAIIISSSQHSGASIAIPI